MLYMADHEGAKIKSEIENLLQSIANVNKSGSTMEGGRRKRKTASKGKGRKMQDDMDMMEGGRRKRKTASKGKGRKMQDDMDMMEGGRRKRKTASKGKGRKMQDDMGMMDGGRRKRKTASKGKSKSKTGSKGRKQKREMNPKFADVMKLQAHIRKDSDLKGGVPMTKVTWALYKANGESYEKTLAAYNKDKAGFAKDVKRETDARAKK